MDGKQEHRRMLPRQDDDRPTPSVLSAVHQLRRGWEARLRASYCEADDGLRNVLLWEIQVPPYYGSVAGDRVFPPQHIELGTFQGPGTRKNDQRRFGLVAERTRETIGWMANIFHEIHCLEVDFQNKVPWLDNAACIAALISQVEVEDWSLSIFTNSDHLRLGQMTGSHG
ncbi:hypothetical protein EKO04_011627 [Ascochyta lentis]|uniref:Uncharacterized protein n=1 Tax=Ascochyta lentis TaxID=205686 RepID=A0A8H7IT92_9PLEO|nr:hypothetical protein EKO04_011627 [Ascochyta lentis]